MKHLKIDTVANLAATTDNVLGERSINNFIDGLALEMLQCDDVNINENIGIDEDSFNSSRLSILNREVLIQLIGDTSITVLIDAYAEAEYNTTDESEVGLGGVGDYAGIDHTYLDIKKITFYLFDGSIFDLTDSTGVEEYLLLNLKIE
jgi:hypothetical protein